MDGWSRYTWNLDFPKSFASFLLVPALGVGMSAELIPFQISFCRGGAVFKSRVGLKAFMDTSAPCFITLPLL